MDCIPSIYILCNRCFSVNYVTSQWMSGVPQFEPICPAYIKATEWDHWGCRENSQRCKGGWGASGGLWGVPGSKWSQLSIEYCSQYIQQRIWTWVSWWDSQATRCLSYSAIESRPSPWSQRYNSRPARCAETAELDGTKSIILTPPHHMWDS